MVTIFNSKSMRKNLQNFESQILIEKNIFTENQETIELSKNDKESNSEILKISKKKFII